MSSVTQLQLTQAAHLAHVSGAPRPVIQPTGRGEGPGPATVTQLRPDITASPAPEMIPDHQRISCIARSVAQGALEVLGGTRPLQQMARWLDPENYERLQLRSNLVRCISTAQGARGSGAAASAHRHVVVRSARVCAVSEAVFEVSVVAFDQKRVRAVALRIEQRRGVWRVTALEIG